MKFSSAFSLLILLTNLAGCATIIGGNKSTAEASGDGVGPATISDGSISLQNDKLSSLTIGGDLNASKLTIINSLSVESSAFLSKFTVRKTTTIGANLTALRSDFYQLATVGGNVSAVDSYFGAGITFAGSLAELKSGSKVVGNVLNTSATPTQLIIDHSEVKGSVAFAVSGGQVIVRNHGKLTGSVTNGSLVSQ